MSTDDEIPRGSWWSKHHTFDLLVRTFLLAVLLGVAALECAALGSFAGFGEIAVRLPLAIYMFFAVDVVTAKVRGVPLHETVPDISTRVWVIMMLVFGAVLGAIVALSSGATLAEALLWTGLYPVITAAVSMPPLLLLRSMVRSRRRRRLDVQPES